VHGPPKTAGGVVVALALLGALAFNVAGIVRLPVGPLGSSDEPGEGRQMTVVPQDEPDEVYTTVILEKRVARSRDARIRRPDPPRHGGRG
jgi:hypothetical protein